MKASLKFSLWMVLMVPFSLFAVSDDTAAIVAKLNDVQVYIQVETVLTGIAAGLIIWLAYLISRGGHI